jgi:MerR family redox-sensitive transcriptional activator SoxR
MTAHEGDLTIGGASARSGVPASTLRYWERTGLLTSPPRVGGRRRYDAAAYRQIEMIALAKRVGFSLAETRTILAGFSEGSPPSDVWSRLAATKLPEVERMLVEAGAMKRFLESGLLCECLSLDQCLQLGAGR